MAAAGTETSLVSRRLFVAVIAIVWLVPSAENCFSAEPDDQLSQRVQMLCRQLDSDLRAERIQAARELRQLGPKILPLLPLPERLVSVAVREEVSQIRNQLERLQASDSTLPTIFTWPESIRLDEACRQIQKQTGNRIDTSPLPQNTLSQTLTSHVAHSTFWQTMEDLRTLAPIDFGPMQRDGVLRLVPIRADATHWFLGVACSGAFRVSADVRPSCRVPNDSSRRLLPIEFEVRPEPRLRTLALRYAEADFQGLSGNNITFVSYSPGTKSELPLGTGKRRILFVVPANVDLTELTLRGKFSAQIAAQTEFFRFSDWTRGLPASQRRGGVNVTLASVEFRAETETTNEAQFRMSVVYDQGGPAFESYRTWMFHNRVFLQLNKGRRVIPRRLETSAQADGAVTVTYRFSGLEVKPTECEFVYEAPTALLDLPIPFEIRGLLKKD